MKKKAKQVLIKSALYVIVASIVALGAFALLPRISAVRADPGIVQLDDLPTGAVVLHDDFPDPDEMLHPLASEQASVAYRSVHSFAALVPSHNAVVMSFAYEYSSSTEAQKAAELLLADLKAAPILISGHEVAGSNGLRGQGFLLKGDEGDSIYWLVGTKDESLVLLLVNGMDASSVTSLFELTIQKITNK